MSRRLFVSIDLPASFEKVLVELDPGIPGVRWVPGNQMHITLGFFPDVSPTVDVALHEKLNAIEFRAFFLPIEGLGTFPAKGEPKILWVGVGAGHPHLFQVHKRVQDAALAVGLEADLRPWHPHITLARCHDVSGNEFARFMKSNFQFNAGMFRVEDFHLYCSALTPAGPIHTCELSIRAR